MREQVSKWFDHAVVKFPSDTTVSMAFSEIGRGGSSNSVKMVDPSKKLIKSPKVKS